MKGDQPLALLSTKSNYKATEVKTTQYYIDSWIDKEV
jgi:hypothetical protein